MRTFALSMRLLARDWRAGELRVLIAALIIAVASVGTVGFFADRVKRALAEQANLLLGADLMISADRPLPDTFADEARRRGLVVSPVIRFNSMVQLAVPDAQSSVLTDVKAVSSDYPLRGAITVADPALADGRPIEGTPRSGEAWIDTRLAERLGATEGTKLAVGESTLTVTKVFAQEPEIAGITFALGPRLLLSLDDVPATKLLAPGNRATWRLLVADRGDSALDDYRAWLGTELQAGQRVESIRDVRPEIRQTLERAEKFLGLAALVAVLMASVAVALASSRYLRRHLDAAAMLRCFGAPVWKTLTLFLLQFVVLGALACAAGVVVALAGQQLLVELMKAAFGGGLPAPGWIPAFAAFASGMLLLMGFAVPPLVALARVPPLRVLRRDLPRPRAGGILAYLAGAVTIGLLIAWQAREAKAGAIMVGGVVALIVAAALIARAMLELLKRLPSGGVSWRFGLANLRRRALASSLQIGALALGLMALLLLTVVRGDLMINWRANLPPDAPNQFLVNVLPEQVADTRAMLSAALKTDASFKPMVRGRLVELNGKKLDTTRYTETRARRLAEREFNLSWTDELPKGNRIVSGAFWSAQGRGADAGMSLEEGIAETLGVKLGDALTFDIGGNRVTANVTSLRKVDWDSFRVNFFALFPPGPLDDMPTTYISAFRAPDVSGAWLSSLVQKYPNILAIDLGEIIKQVQVMMDRVSRAIEFVFLFTLAGGLLVLQAAIASTQDERKFDAAVLRTLGASERQLRGAQIAEFLLLGALAGAVAAAGATIIGWQLADRVFNIPFSGNPWLWVYGIGGGAIAVTVAGWIGTRSTVRQPPLAVLRQLG